MIKTCFLPILVLLGTVCLTSQATLKKEITMLVVPRDAKTIKIAQDVAQLEPVLIVSYQQTAKRLKLYAWNGEGWVDLSAEDYANGAFFENPPKHAIIIEPENTPSAELLVPDGTWCESGNRLTTTDPRAVIHLLGLYFDFPHRHWKRFSKTSGLSVADINPGLINIFWWQYPKKRPTLDPKADLKNWQTLDITPPKPIESVVVEEEPEPIEPAETPAVEVEVEEKLPKIAPVEEKIEPVVETIEEIAKTLEAAPEVVVDPFSATEIPAAEVVLPE